MIREAIDRILSLSAVEKIDLDGRQLFSKPLVPVKQAEAATIKCHTLTGLVSFIATLGEVGIDSHSPIIHVRDYDDVAVVSNLFGTERQRETLAVGNAYEIRHRFSEYLPVEDFITYLQSCFVQGNTTAAIMQIVGNLTQGVEATYADDGMTQRVTAKAGVTRRPEVVDLPNPVTLRPYRTFADIEQPASLFVLRIKADAGSSPKVALFEADGGGWKNTAIGTIKAWFATHAPDVALIA